MTSTHADSMGLEKNLLGFDKYNSAQGKELNFRIIFDFFLLLLEFNYITSRVDFIYLCLKLWLCLKLFYFSSSDIQTYIVEAVDEFHENVPGIAFTETILFISSWTRIDTNYYHFS